MGCSVSLTNFRRWQATKPASPKITVTDDGSGMAFAPGLGEPTNVTRFGGFGSNPSLTNGFDSKAPFCPSKERAGVPPPGASIVANSPPSDESKVSELNTSSTGVFQTYVRGITSLAKIPSTIGQTNRSGNAPNCMELLN